LRPRLFGEQNEFATLLVPVVVFSCTRFRLGVFVGACSFVVAGSVEIDSETDESNT